MPTDPTATITFNYNNGNPIWSIDKQPLKVPQGSQTVLWQLSPQSTSGSAFKSTGGIAFNTKSGNTWPGTTPVAAGPTIYRATENNNNPGPNGILYSYSVTVTYQTKDYTWDPDVENDPPPPRPVGDPPVTPPPTTGRPPGGGGGGGNEGGGGNQGGGNNPGGGQNP